MPRLLRAIALALLLVAPPAACGGADELGEVAAVPADRLQIAAAGRLLRAADADRLGGERVEQRERGRTFAGVRLRDLLADAGVDLADLRAVEALAADGYRHTLTREQALADSTLVVDREGDAALTGRDGPLRLLVVDDREASVRALRRLVVNPAAAPRS